MAAGVVVGSANQETGERDGDADGYWPPDVTADGSQILIVFVVVGIPTTAALPDDGVTRMLAVVAEKHRLRTFRAVKDGDDGTWFDFGNAAAGVDQLGAAARFRHKEIALAGFGAARDALKPVSVVNENLPLNRA